jgi:ribosome biogenesis GTPase / thiamine phosphate phosphatase
VAGFCFAGIRNAAMFSGNNPNYDQGVVTRKDIGIYQVMAGDKTIPCALSSKLNKFLIYSADNPNAQRRRVKDVYSLENTDPVVVGDRVYFMHAPGGGGLIAEVLPRRNRLVRRDPAPSAHPFEQVIASNLDYMIPVFAFESPTPKWGMLDRYLVSAESLELKVLIVMTKSDLLADPGSDGFGNTSSNLEVYRRIGYPILITSSLSGKGIEELRGFIKDKVSIFVGKSGVGKSSLLNAVEPGLGLRIQEVSRGKIGKGRHTTSHVELHPLSFGGSIIDTPGAREFELHFMDDLSLALAFPEIRPHVGRCKFGLSCTHDEEPGCQVRQAVTSGEISPNRYRSFLRMRMEL